MDEINKNNSPKIDHEHKCEADLRDALDHQIPLIIKGTIEVLPEHLLSEKLINKPRIIKAGFDPTAPDLHLGHLVLIKKLKQLQDLGHSINIIIGDFTAMIGDPTGKNTTRPKLSKEEVLINAKTYTDQVYKILDKNKTIIHFNSTWLNELNIEEIIKLTSTYTVARMLERNDFYKRFHNNIDISIHEFLYPLLQGYDSVAIKSAIELGGTDQKFNLLMGRTLQKHYHQEPQHIITMPLLVGLDGIHKMSKSLNNYIGITESPIEIFGKIMSISDTLMWHYYALLSKKSENEVNTLKQDSSNHLINPRDVKIMLAKEIITDLHTKELALMAEEDFILRFSNKSIPDNIDSVDLSHILNEQNGINPFRIVFILKHTGLCVSSSEAIRIIKQGGVKINNIRIDDVDLLLEPNTLSVIQIGKRKFIKIQT